jgi:hypothetical protein
MLAHGWWFSPDTPAFSTTKTGPHNIAESGVKHTKNQSINQTFPHTIALKHLAFLPLAQLFPTQN